MHRHWGTVIVLAACLALIIWRFQPRWASTDPESRNASAFRALAEPASCTVNGIPLAEAIAQLASDHDVEIETGDLSLPNAERVLNQPVHLDLKGVSLASALSVLMRDAERQLEPETRLTWTVKSGRIAVCAEDDLRDSTALYVGRLHVIPAAAGGSDGIDSLALSEVIQGTIDVSSWEYTGGAGVIRELPNALAVSHSAMMQQIIGELIAALVHCQRDPSLTRPIEVQPWEFSVEVRERLDDRITVDFDSVSVESALANVQQTHSLPLYVDRVALVENGIDIAGQLVSVRLSDVKISSVLKSLLCPVGLVAQVRGDVVFVTSFDQAESYEIVKVYPVADLLSIPGIDADWIIDLAECHVAPNLWDSVGGESALQVCGNAMVVSGVDEVHRQLDQMLSAIRRHLDPLSDRIAEDPAVLSDAENPIVSLEFDQVRLQDIVARLHDEHGVNIVLDLQELAGLRARENTRVSGKWEHDRLTKGLRRTLKPLGLDIAVDDDVILVTSSEGCGARLLLRVYNTRPLLRNPLGQRFDADRLIDLVQTVVTPNDWDAVGGESSLGTFDGLILVSHDAPGHGTVSRLLGRLMEVPDLPLGTRMVEVTEARADSHSTRLDSDPSAPAVRIYLLPKWMQQRTGLRFDEIIRQQVTPSQWSDVGGIGELVPFRVAGRDIVVVRHDAQRHQQVAGLIEACWRFDPDAPTDDAPWPVDSPAGSARIDSFDVESLLKSIDATVGKSRQHETRERLLKSLRGSVRSTSIYMILDRVLVLGGGDESSERLSELTVQSIDRIRESAEAYAGMPVEARSVRIRQLLKVVSARDSDRSLQDGSEFLLYLLLARPADLPVGELRVILQSIEPERSGDILELVLGKVAMLEHDGATLADLLAALADKSDVMQRERILETLGDLGPAATEAICRLAAGDNFQVGLSALRKAARADPVSVRPIVQECSRRSGRDSDELFNVLVGVDPDLKVTRQVIEGMLKSTDASARQAGGDLMRRVQLFLGESGLE